MFYVAEALIASKGLSFSSHGAVLSAFGKKFAKTGELSPDFHRRLIDAQELRNTGDYGVGPNIGLREADLVCQWAEDFIQAAEAYLGSR